MSVSASQHIETSLLNPIHLEKTNTKSYWENLNGCAESLALASAIQLKKQFHIVVAPDSNNAQRIEHELEFFLDDQIPVLTLPAWETLPYDCFSPLSEITSQRLQNLTKLARAKYGVMILTAATLMQRIAPKNHILANSFSWEVGTRLSLEEMKKQLDMVGYQNVAQVCQHGEFTIRGSILDIFPMGSSEAYRIELFDDEIESIRTFNVDNQRSITKFNKISLFPTREFPFDEATIKNFRQKFRAEFPNAKKRNPIYQDVSNGIMPAGIEYYLPLFVDETNTLFDYCPPQSIFVFIDSVMGAAREFEIETEQRFQQRCHDLERPILNPTRLFLTQQELSNLIENHAQIHIRTEADTPEDEVVKFASQTLTNVCLHPQENSETQSLSLFINEFDGRILLTAETPGHREALLDTLKLQSITPKLVSNWQEFLTNETKLCLLVAPIDHGLCMVNPMIAIITENQLNGTRAQQRRRRRRSSSRDLETIVSNLSELSQGSPVVHQEHGIGRYLGLQTLAVENTDTEFLILEYANNDKIYVPVSSLHKIGRYTGASAENAPLHKLGGEQWGKAKKKAAAKIIDIAAELLDVHAQRAAITGRSHSIDMEEYTQFALSFPFEETPDQETAIGQVMEDLQAIQPMDRVICGDVGFGKTEVCMRAAFIAVQNTRQVAILVPTTLLAQQHYQNFCDRFADWPIRIEVISRFVAAKQQQLLINDIESGKIDIIIGTHKLLQNTIKYQDLGLVVIDEEHRFGVRQKEYFKKLRNEVDLLTLTATPIPRTLNMAMSGLRDISIIASPPPNRHSINTFISEWVDSMIQEACLREIRRGGQIFFLHNNVKTIERTAAQLESLLPEARIEIAHGQMPERQLEQIMLDFYHQRFNLLLCTTIIESGIDIPSANTILLNRADKLGLAQLHQLRGRVGRSHHRAYAYFIVPPKKLMTRDAGKRLAAVEASDSLGAGFMLSSHDLEIRGAGELLGDEQSGQIQEIGFSLYTEMLDRAIASLKSGDEPELESPLFTGPEIELHFSSLIPDTYLPDVHTRLILYKRIANAQNVDELRDLKVEMIDRFGLLPEETKNLFAITEMKLQSAEMGIRKIEANQSGGRILFTDKPNINSNPIIKMIEDQPTIFKMDGPEQFRIVKPFKSKDEILQFFQELLASLKIDQTT